MTLTVQFYTLRDFTRTRDGFGDALRRCRQIGYEAVQLSAVGCLDAEVSAEEARRMLDEADLRAVATHRPVDRLFHHVQEEIEFHRTLDADYTAPGSIYGEYGNTPDGYRKFLRDAEEVTGRYQEAGIDVGYHNHAHEFELVDGVAGFDILTAESAIQMEIDTYWVALGGRDPSVAIAAMPGRVRAVHAKDRAEDGTMAAIGEGNLDWSAILNSCRSAGTEYLIVEQDVCPRDPFDCLAASYRYLAGRV